MALGAGGDAGERRFEHDRRDRAGGGEVDRHPRSQRLAPQHGTGRRDPLRREKSGRRFRVDHQSALTGLPGIAAKTAIFGEQHAIALMGQATQALGAIADMAAIAVQIKNDRALCRRGPVPRQQAKTVGGGYLDRVDAVCGKITEHRPHCARMVKQAPLTHIKPADNAAVSGQSHTNNRVEHRDGVSASARGGGRLRPATARPDTR